MISIDKLGTVPNNTRMETPDLKSLLLEKARYYCQVTGKSINTAGLESVNDGKFFDRLEKGGGFTNTTFAKAMRWFDDNTPSGKITEAAHDA